MGYADGDCSDQRLMPSNMSIMLITMTIKLTIIAVALLLFLLPSLLMITRS